MPAGTRINVLRDPEQPFQEARTRPMHLFLRDNIFPRMLPCLDIVIENLRKDHCLSAFLSSAVFYPLTIDKLQALRDALEKEEP